MSDGSSEGDENDSVVKAAADLKVALLGIDPERQLKVAKLHLRHLDHSVQGLAWDMYKLGLEHGAPTKSPEEEIKLEGRREAAKRGPQTIMLLIGATITSVFAVATVWAIKYWGPSPEQPAAQTSGSAAVAASSTATATASGSTAPASTAFEPASSTSAAPTPPASVFSASPTLSAVSAPSGSARGPRR